MPKLPPMMTIVDAARHSLTTIEGIKSITRDFVQQGDGHQGYVWDIESSCGCYVQVWATDSTHPASKPSAPHKPGEQNLLKHCREHEAIAKCGCRRMESEDQDRFKHPQLRHVK